MLPKVVFNKTAFVKFKISNNIKQNIGETDWKQPQIHRKNPYQPMGFKNLKKKKSTKQKSRDFRQTLWFPIKNYIS